MAGGYLVSLTIVMCLGVQRGVSGEGWIKVRFDRYTNPGGLGDNGHCCDGKWGVCQSDGCDHRFTVCLRSESGKAGSGMTTDQCNVGERESSEIENQNTNEFGPVFGGVDNPMSFQLTGPLPDSFHVKVDVTDEDSWFSDDLVEILEGEVQFPADPKTHFPVVIEGRTRLEATVWVECSPDQYGRLCGTHCPAPGPGDDYACDLNTGEKTYAEKASARSSSVQKAERKASPLAEISWKGETIVKEAERKKPTTTTTTMAREPTTTTTTTPKPTTTTTTPKPTTTTTTPKPTTTTSTTPQPTTTTTTASLKKTTATTTPKPTTTTTTPKPTTTTTTPKPTTTTTIPKPTTTTTTPKPTTTTTTPKPTTTTTTTPKPTTTTTTPKPTTTTTTPKPTTTPTTTPKPTTTTTTPIPTTITPITTTTTTTPKPTTTTTTTPKPTTPSSSRFDCDEWARGGFAYQDGVYELSVAGIPTFSVWCDMELCGDGWTVIQRRNGENDQLTDFNRNWQAYRQGFGDVGMTSEYWLGLERIHRLTVHKNMALHISMQVGFQEFRWARYESFWVESEENGYTLHAEGYTGNAGDALNYLGLGESMLHNGQPFSTPDQDNDNWDGSCAQKYQSGWWFNNCAWANLNGVYRRAQKGAPPCEQWECISWRTIEGAFSLLATEMKIRPNPEDKSSITLSSSKGAEMRKAESSSKSDVSESEGTESSSESDVASEGADSSSENAKSAFENAELSEAGGKTSLKESPPEGAESSPEGSESPPEGAESSGDESLLTGDESYIIDPPAIQ